MTSTAKQELFERANDLDLILKNVQSSGRTWKGRIHDGTGQGRPPQDFIGDQAEVERQIANYASSRIVAAPVPVFTNAPAEIIEIPAEADDAYEAGYNDGLAEGLKMAGVTFAAPAASQGPQPPAESQRVRELVDELGGLKNELAAAKDFARHTTEQVQKRDAVLLAQREDLTRLLAEAEARSQMRLQSVATVRYNITRELDKAVNDLADNALPGEHETRLIATRRDGWLRTYDKALASVGLGTDGTRIMPLPGSKGQK